LAFNCSSTSVSGPVNEGIELDVSTVPDQSRLIHAHSNSRSADHLPRSPARDGHAVEIDFGGTAGAPSVDLEVGQQRGTPAEGECGRNSCVDGLLGVVEPDGVVGNIAVVVPGVADLQMMPGVDAPVLDIAGRGGMRPVIDGNRGCTGVFGVVPGAGVAVALESVDNGLSIGHDLVHIEFEIADFRRQGGQVDPHVIKKVCGRGIGAEGDIVTLAAGVGIGGVELTGLAAARRVGDELHFPVGGSAAAAGASVVGGPPVAERLDSTDNYGVRRDGVGIGIGACRSRACCS
jgi:hypothetical protein